ncbi:hypothetical protein FSS13T_00690 [Flavobacterium saliperosum S13]|uniref:Cytochrome c domain-containing protein n=2 Tax=Flavobacterium saliperosum TaxID=329186 RepID=A0A1G4V3D3_9FLAO|nr:hypothetical protein [Flavobacterium saliperosum]ESU28608.1 hypothetical protein FSS13T_00690 [Flavobacterium saliperosum S13]SCW99984.1 hypothetical protein SAMN02927925_00072 [Flavobacterium saliperosum]
MNARKITILATVTLITVSCSNDSESDLTGYSQIENVTYNGTVRTIIVENCIVCHSQPPQGGAPMSLVTYDELKDAVLTKGLIDRISSFDPGFGMPFGGPRLPQSKINQIIAWRDANFPE